jgi:hypothetical protein
VGYGGTFIAAQVVEKDEEVNALVKKTGEHALVLLADCGHCLSPC